MSAPENPTCALCPYDWSERYCRRDKGKGPKNCPSLLARDLKEEAAALVGDPEILAFSRNCSMQEAAGYGGREQGYARVHPVKPRLLEIVEFAQRMGYRKLALIFCVGLRKEAAIVHGMFEDHGFETVSVICKVGRVPKSAIGIERENQVDPTVEVETMCNPVMQALVANRSGAELNVLLGLCVGHDSLFIRHAAAPVTVLAVKDRLLGHNPLAAVYTYDSYYRSLKTPKD
ncbi:MAG: DUF1847 domain-containing protein [Desulfovibrionaceae bacterium]